MKYSLVIILALITIYCSGQSCKSYKYFKNSWTQGKIDPNGKVVKADPSRGGWYSLQINPDETVLFSDPVNCGFGHEKKGKYSINKKDKTITFNFTQQIGYTNAPGTTDINETVTYKIERINKSELILKMVGQEKTLQFILTKNSKD